MKTSPLLKFMLERHAIYLRRQVKGATPPFTRDAILSRYKFTNVYRELDRVTIWIRNMIREPYAEDPHLWFMLCVARQVNWPPTLRALIDAPWAWPQGNAWRADRALRVLEDRARNGEQVFTGAYIITNGGLPVGTPKAEAVIERYLLPLWHARDAIEPEMHESLEHTVETLSRHFGWGGFMSYEVACDLRHTRYLRDAPDKQTWAHAGPGARRGLRRVTGTYPRAAECLPLMRALHTAIYSKWPHLPKLELRDIEHSLCEFDKYERARLGEGRPRALFKPTNGDLDGSYH